MKTLIKLLKVSVLVLIVLIIVIISTKLVPSPVNIQNNSSYYINNVYESDNPVFAPLIKGLRAAEKSDTITIYLQTPGGSVLTAFQLINAMNDSKAHIITVADGSAASAGYMTLVNGDEMKASKHGFVLAHLARYSDALGSCILPLTNRFQQMVANIVASRSDHIFTEQEAVALLRGGDVILTNTEFNNRLIDPVVIGLSPTVAGFDIMTISSERFIELVQIYTVKHKKSGKECINR